MTEYRVKITENPKSATEDVIGWENTTTPSGYSFKGNILNTKDEEIEEDATFSIFGVSLDSIENIHNEDIITLLAEKTSEGCYTVC